MSGGNDGPPAPPKRQSSTKGKHIIQNNPLPKGQSCISCRTRKVRCDGRMPACAACLRTARFERRDLSEVRCQYVQRKSPSTSPPARSSSELPRCDDGLKRTSPDLRGLKTSARLRQRPVSEGDELAPSIGDRGARSLGVRKEAKDPQASQRRLSKSPYRRAEPLPPRLSIPCTRPSVLECPGEPSSAFQYSLPPFSAPTSHPYLTSAPRAASLPSPASTVPASWPTNAAYHLPAYPIHPAIGAVPSDPDHVAYGGNAFQLRPTSSDSARPVQFAPYTDAHAYDPHVRQCIQEPTSAPVSSASSPARSSYRSLSRLSSVSQPSVFQLPSPTSTSSTPVELCAPTSLGIASIPLPPPYLTSNDAAFSTFFLAPTPCPAESSVPVSTPSAYQIPALYPGSMLPDPFHPGQTIWSELDLVASEMLANEPTHSVDFLPPPPLPTITTAVVPPTAVPYSI